MKNNQHFQLHPSLGVAQSVAGGSVENLLTRVDKALYAAKTHGRDRVEVAIE